MAQRERTGKNIYIFYRNFEAGKNRQNEREKMNDRIMVVFFYIFWFV